MQLTLPRLVQHAASPVRKSIDSQDNWIWIFSYPEKQAAMRGYPYAAQILKHRRRAGPKGADVEPLAMDLPNARGSHLSYAFIQPGRPAFELLTLARKLVVPTSAVSAVSAVRVPPTAANRPEERALADRAGAARSPAFATGRALGRPISKPAAVSSFTGRSRGRARLPCATRSSPG